MIRRADRLLTGLTLAAACLLAGCSSSATTLTGGAAEVGGLKNEDPMARPVGVAWTSARAKRCGFYFNPDKLRTSYLTWERTQGAPPEQLAKIEATYDTAFKKTFADVSGDTGYCTEHKGGEIKADLQRYLAGDYTPNLPQPKRVTSCTGFIGCQTTGEDPFSTKGFLDKYDRDHPAPGP
jgi:hypothetical protein